MTIEKLLPDNNKSIKKCIDFYKYEDAAGISRKNRRMILQGYIVTLILFLLCLCRIISEVNDGVKSILDIIPLILLTPAVFLLIYKSRYSAIDSQVKRNKESIVEDLPELIDKVILLLNTGMFIEAVIAKAAEDYSHGENDSRERKILYICLNDIIRKAYETNTPLIHEMSEFAVKSGVRELIRFSAIVENNFNKGSDLAEKLEGEGALLWMGKKKLVEEKAKMAGTKLSLPLMLLLSALILITSAPMLLSI